VPPPVYMLGASLLFALMAACVKLASVQYGAGEIVFYRSLIGLALMAAALRGCGVAWRTPVPAMHFWRSLSGTVALCLWFYSVGVLPLGTATTLNYTAPLWIALFLIGGSVMLAPNRVAIDGRLVATVLVGFAGVALVLKPTLDPQQMWGGVLGLLSGVISAVAYLGVTALGRAGEPSERVVLYFSASGVVAGAGLALLSGPLHDHTPRGLLLLAAIGALATAAQWLMTRAYTAGATLGIATLQYLGIAYAFALGVWLFDDPVTPQALAGMGLIIGAGVAATFLRGRPQRQDAAPTET